MFRSTNNKAKRLIFSLFWSVILSGCQALPMNQHNVIVHDEYVNKGDILPIDSITTIEGDVINTHQIGKRKLIILFATWCDDSKRLLTALNSSLIVDDNSIEIIAISREESAETVVAWRNENNINFSLATDVGRNVYKKFASGGIPRVITVGENNKIIKMNLVEGAQGLEKIVWK